MTKFTEGPWKVTARFQDKIDVHHSDDAPGAASSVIARVTCRDSWAEEQTANAELIAAAPALGWLLSRAMCDPEELRDQWSYDAKPVLERLGFPWRGRL